MLSHKRVEELSKTNPTAYLPPCPVCGRLLTSKFVFSFQKVKTHKILFSNTFLYDVGSFGLVFLVWVLLGEVDSGCRSSKLWKKKNF